MQVTTHAMIGWLISQPLSERRDRALVTAAAVAPDLDAAALLFGQDAFLRHHHTLGHNLFAAMIVAQGLALLAANRKKAGVYCLLAFLSHLLKDMLGSGADWPIPLLWPYSSRQFAFAPPFQWELASWQNLLIAMICIAAILIIAVKKNRSIVEVFSVQADARVVSAIQGRFAKMKIKPGRTVF